jgi:hypothetical protein
MDATRQLGDSPRMAGRINSRNISTVAEAVERSSHSGGSLAWGRVARTALFAVAPSVVGAA